jgi:AcrR family transcriptional regulator
MLSPGAEVGVSKGSSYHFFSSKEEFGLAIIDYDSQMHDRIVEQYLDNTNLSPLNRLKRYCPAKTNIMMRRYLTSVISVINIVRGAPSKTT